MVNNVWVSYLPQGPRAASRGAGCPGAQTAGRCAGLWTAEIPKASNGRSWDKASVPRPSTCPTLNLCTLKVLEKVKFIFWKKGSNKSSFGSFDWES